jgi:hypothetical protein
LERSGAGVPQVLEEYQEQYYYAWWVMRAGLLSTRFFFTRGLYAIRY